MGCAWGLGRKRSFGVGDRVELGFIVLGWRGWLGFWELYSAVMSGGGCWVFVNVEGK